MAGLRYAFKYPRMRKMLLLMNPSGIGPRSSISTFVNSSTILVGTCTQAPLLLYLVGVVLVTDWRAYALS